MLFLSLLLQKKNFLGIFDSHSRGADGKSANNGVACLILKDNVQDIYDILYKNFGAISEEEIRSRWERPEDVPFVINQYQFFSCRVQILPAPFLERFPAEDCEDINAQRSLEPLASEVRHPVEQTGENVIEMISVPSSNFIVMGRMNQGNSKFEPSNGKQCTAMAAASLAMFVVKDPPTWTADTIQAILDTGNSLYESSINNRNEPAQKTSNPDFLEPIDVDYAFTLGGM